MPELPEVETIRRQLEPVCVGRRIESLRVLDPRWTAPVNPRAVEAAVAGRLVEALERRGKYLIFRLDGHRSLVMHLRMTGNLTVTALPEEPLADERLAPAAGREPYLRAELLLEGGVRLAFTDARRFGHAVVLDGYALEGYLNARVGIEPLSEELTAAAICRLAAGRRAPLKSFLLDQSAIAGIGNIYADEALFRAGLHPLSPAGSLRPEHCERLREAIVATLEAGLSAGGASIDDYRDARGERGAAQDEFLVHAREGEPCPRCSEAIRRIVVSGRSTYFCPRCQRRLRARPRRGARAPARG